MKNKGNYIIIFDGVCNFCNGAVNFIIKRDIKGVFQFTPMQSDIAQKLIDSYHESKKDLDTIILIKNGVFYIRSEAALEIAKELTGFWFLFRIFKILPVTIRDVFYKVFANNRYKLFGKREVCMIPTLEQRNRFIS
ncbi:MAG: thiol-disulfide oxidoreductase DCC family protein [Bacteroidetes bacterium]|nr:thiol-disulfide oxidoreductase DCC family protein [Bacteroidota bacterium]MBU1116646.1 thiol-disulfide oxidoreductase DCC family protein [Bacteroidota bacterium]MBU1797503.1 thiol-disulfide oxidoreductase DCC family protein [Bacteroidota bacterium]